MEVAFTHAEETRLTEIAAEQGMSVSEYVRITAVLAADSRSGFTAAIDEGLACIERGETISDEEMWARVDRLLAHR